MLESEYLVPEIIEVLVTKYGGVIKPEHTAEHEAWRADQTAQAKAAAEAKAAKAAAKAAKAAA